MKAITRILQASGLLLVLFLFGCSSMMTMKDQFKGVNAKVGKRDFAGALAELEASKEKYYEAKDRVMYYLDVGMLSHYLGDYEKSNAYLTKAEYAIEELYTESVSKAIGSMLLNDNAMDYAGEDYEDIYLNVFKALNYIHLNLWDDAVVEIKRISIKLNLLEDKYKKLANEYNKDKDAKIKVRTGTNNFYNSALARYLSLIIYRAEGAWDSARIDRDKIREAFGTEANYYPFPAPNLDNALSSSANAKVSIVCFSGRSPDKVANTLRLASQKNALVFVTSKENEPFKEEMTDFDVIPWPGISSDYYFKLQLPVMKVFGSNVRSFRVVFDQTIDGEETGQQFEATGELIESLERVAKLAFEVKKPMIYLKTIIRTVVKGLVAAEGKKAMQKNDKSGWGTVLSIVTDVAVELSENADLRVSHYFPGFASIADLDLPPGTYHVRVEYFGGNGDLLFTDEQGEREIKRNALNVVESVCLK